MLVYHFIPQKWGLDDLRKRRLKVAVITELNDPFELLGANLKDEELRRVLQHNKRQMSACSGFLCFSEKWTSPAQWAHYADNHRGLCFGFDVREPLKKIGYCDERAIIPTERFLDPGGFSAAETDHLFYTKAKCWEYEAERRLFIPFEKCRREKRYHYYPFSKTLTLREIYVGASSTLREATLRKAIDGLMPEVKIIKVRPAFGSFTLTPDLRWPPYWAIPKLKPLPSGTFKGLMVSEQARAKAVRILTK
jgi:hypothetical protein